jgi:hypothetical protein
MFVKAYFIKVFVVSLKRNLPRQSEMLSYVSYDFRNMRNANVIFTQAILA